MIIHNTEIDEYFAIALEPHNIVDPLTGKVIFEMYRGQAFRWLYKTQGEETNCITCNSTPEHHVIISYYDCKEFKDAEGKKAMYKIPSKKLIETYDVSDVVESCGESWLDELGGYNLDLFTPPYLRKDAKDWNIEKGISNSKE